MEHTGEMIKGPEERKEMISIETYMKGTPSLEIEAFAHDGRCIHTSLYKPFFTNDMIGRYLRYLFLKDEGQYVLDVKEVRIRPNWKDVEPPKRDMEDDDGAVFTSAGTIYPDITEDDMVRMIAANSGYEESVVRGILGLRGEILTQALREGKSIEKELGCLVTEVATVPGKSETVVKAAFHEDPILEMALNNDNAPLIDAMNDVHGLGE